MDLFKSLLQPTIVHLGKNTTYPVSDEYFLNYNVMQIDWFANNSIVLENGLGILLLEDYNESNPYSASGSDAMDIMDDGIKNTNDTVLDVPRIYFKISDKFLTNNKFLTPNIINNFIITLLQLSDTEDMMNIASFIANGDSYNGESLIPGVDYYINETFARFLIEIELEIENENFILDQEIKDIVNTIHEITLPNYLSGSAEIKYPWIQLTDDEINNTDLEYYFDKNLLSTLNDEDAVRNFFVSFCQTILDYNEDKEIPVSDIENTIYKKVLEYFASNKYDEGLASIQLILGNTIKTEKINTISNCCSNTAIESCLDTYMNAMNEYLKLMLGNADFYWNWMMEETEDGKQPKTSLIKQLMYLINAFESLGLDLSFKPASKYSCTNGCHSNQSQVSINNYNILDKYKNVLSYVRDCKISSNINKIKLYGSQFGELLPKLQF
jgi:hypothetical protein